MQSTTHSHGRTLGLWLEACGKNQSQLAADLGVSRGAVWAWVHGRSRPGGHQRDRIEALSNGAVLADLWRTPVEVAELVADGGAS